MQVKDNKLVDLYRRFLNFVTTNYPDAIITENKKSVMINYPGELARIFVYLDKPTSSLLIKIAKDITQKMSDTNGRIYYLSSIDELNMLKSGIQVIMDMKIPDGIGPAQVSDTEAEAEDPSQGYLYDCHRNPLGVVYVDRIPTNAFVYSSDKINMPVDLSEEEAVTSQQGQKRGTIAKFFKR